MKVTTEQTGPQVSGTHSGPFSRAAQGLLQGAGIPAELRKQILHTLFLTLILIYVAPCKLLIPEPNLSSV